MNTRRERHPQPRLSGRDAGERKSTHDGLSTGLGSFCAAHIARIVEGAIGVTVYASIYWSVYWAKRKAS